MNRICIGDKLPVACGRWLIGGLALALVVLQSACGGGGGATATTPPVTSAPATALPATLQVDLPVTAEVGAALAFKTGLPAGASDLRYEWDFGDSQRSTDAQPTHAWPVAGRYTWRVTVSNGDGATVSASGTLQVGWFARLSSATCSGATAGTGWCWQGASVGDFARSVHCADGSHCVAVGDLGQAAYTRDGGRTWTLSRVPSAGETLVLVRMATADTVYAFGGLDGRTVWRSRNGGQTWVLASRPATPLFANAFSAPGRAWTLDADTLVATGCCSWISRDAGATWVALPMQVADITRNGFFWANGGGSFSPDQGVTQRPVAGAFISGTHYRSVMDRLANDAVNLRLFVQDTLVTPTGAVTSYVLLSSADGGQTFAEAPVQLPALPQGAQLSSVALRADGRADALAARSDFSRGSTPVLPVLQRLRSNDGGRTWTSAGPLVADGQIATGAGLTSDRGAFVVASMGLADDPNGPPRRLDLLDLDTLARATVSAPGEAVPDLWLDRVAGKLLQRWRQARLNASSVDMGQNWSSLPPGQVDAQVLFDSKSLLFFDPLQGLAVSNGDLAITDDGGRSWRRPSPPLALAGNQLTRLSDGSVMLTDFARAFRSTDRGRSWTPMTMAARASSGMFFLDAQQGWVGACSVDSPFLMCTPQLQRTIDGGASWQLVAPLPSMSFRLAFSTATEGVMQDISGVTWWTGDGGVTWAKSALVDSAGQRSDTQSFGPLRLGRGGLAWMPAPLAGREVMLRSVDGARTWRPVDLALSPLVDARLRVQDLFNLDDRLLWAVGSNGLALASNDGGLSWRVQNTGTLLDLTAVTAIDAQTAWMAGGSISFTTSTGGD